MDEKKELLRQIGWSEELIEKCLSPDNKPPLKLPQVEYHAPIASEQDVTSLFVSLDTPTITDGTNL
jgi:hypothetical protein